MGLPVGPKTHTSRTDLCIASLAWGFTLGFGESLDCNVWQAVKQTLQSKHPWRSVYLALVWGEVIANFIFALVAYLFLLDYLQATFAVLFTIVFTWCFQVQLLLQIIINRINVIQSDRRKQRLLKYVMAALWACINVSGFCIWVPARMGVSGYAPINFVWDRTEKVVYLITDCLLNYFFVKMVTQRLVQRGSTKYDKLVKFNKRIIIISICMDILLLSSMQLKNDLVYLQVHPLSFTVKLNIEMTMATLIRKIAQDKDLNGKSGADAYGNNTYHMAITGGRTQHGDGSNENTIAQHEGEGVMVHTQVIVERELADDGQSDSSSKTRINAEDESPLRDNTWSRVTYNTSSK